MVRYTLYTLRGRKLGASSLSGARSFACDRRERAGMRIYLRGWSAAARSLGTTIPGKRENCRVGSLRILFRAREKEKERKLAPLSFSPPCGSPMVDSRRNVPANFMPDIGSAGAHLRAARVGWG